MSSHFRIALGIRAQLLLVLTVFLAIPWLGYEYVRELERFLRDAQEQTLAGTAQAVATALHDRPRLFDVPPAPARVAGGRALAATLRRSPTPRVAAARLDAGAGKRRRSPEIEQIIQGLSRTTARIWVIDRELNVLARAGSLKRSAAAGRPSAATRASPRAWRWLERETLASVVRAGAAAAERGLRRRAGRARRAAGAGGRRRAVGHPHRRATADAGRQGGDRLGGASDLGRRPGQGRGASSRRRPTPCSPSATARSSGCSPSCSPRFSSGRSR